jgi:hypothetical protein
MSRMTGYMAGSASADPAGAQSHATSVKELEMIPS